MSPREVRSEEVKLEATEEAELSPAPESLSLGAMDTVQQRSEGTQYRRSSRASR